MWKTTRILISLGALFCAAGGLCAATAPDTPAPAATAHSDVLSSNVADNAESLSCVNETCRATPKCHARWGQWTCLCCYSEEVCKKGGCPQYSVCRHDGGAAPAC